LDLPAGIFLVSDVTFDDRTPYVAVELGTRPSREALWIRIRDLKLAGTHFWGFRNQAEALKTQIYRNMKERIALTEGPLEDPAVLPGFKLPLSEVFPKEKGEEEE
jgi:hypothetical protein